MRVCVFIIDHKVPPLFSDSGIGSVAPYLYTVKTHVQLCGVISTTGY